MSGTGWRTYTLPKPSSRPIPDLPSTDLHHPGCPKLDKLAECRQAHQTAGAFVLTTLKIRDFKSIRKSELSLGRVNLFIGPNGGGKSNVLEAIGLLAASLDRGVDQRTLEDHGVRTSHPRMMKSAFKRTRLSPNFELGVTLKSDTHPVDVAPDCTYRFSATATEGAVSLKITHEYFSIGSEKVYSRMPSGIVFHKHKATAKLPAFSDLPEDRSLWDSIKHQLHISHHTKFSMNALSTYAIYAPDTSVLRGIAKDPSRARPLGLAGSGMANAFVDFVEGIHSKAHSESAMNRLGEMVFKSGWVDRIHAAPRDTSVVPMEVEDASGKLIYLRDRFMKNGRNMLSAFDASEGTLFALFIAILLGHPKTPPILAIDNVDRYLNPFLVRNLIEHIGGLVCDDSPDAGSVSQQVFMTAHQPTSLDALDLFDDNHRLFVVSRSVDGDTEIRRIQPPAHATRETWIVTNKGRNLSQLYLDGRIPGLKGNEI